MQKRKGFTLVELVIVIAVIAILAGVLIGTFASVINRANDSANIQKTKSDEIAQKAEDIIKKIEDTGWVSWEDYEADIVKKIVEEVKANNTDQAKIIEKVVQDAITTTKATTNAEASGVTEEQVKAIVENAIGTLQYEGPTEAQVKAAVSAKFGEEASEQLSSSDIKSIIDKANGFNYTAADLAYAIAIIPIPVSNFSVNTILGCIGESTRFLNEQIQELKALIEEQFKNYSGSTTDTDPVVLAKAYNIRIRRANASSLDTVYDVLSVIKALDDIVTTDDSTPIYFNLENKTFFVKDEIELGRSYNVPSDFGTTSEKYKYWVFKNNVDPTYSTYLLNYEGDTITNLSAGLDVGANTIIKIDYVQKSATQSVVIRTNGGTLTIDAPNDDIAHYGYADSVNIVEVKSSSYHENGTVPFIQISKGNIVLEKTADVNGIHVANVQIMDEQGNITKTINEFTHDVVLTLNGFEVKLTRDTVGTALEQAVLVCEVKATSTSDEYIWLFGNGTIESAKVYVTSTNAAPNTAVASTTTTENASDAAFAIANNATNTGTEENPVWEATESGKAAEEAQAASTLRGSGTQADPFLIYDYRTMQRVSEFYDLGYYYFEVALDRTDNGKIDCSGWTPVKLHGSFDGKGVKFVNVTACLFQTVGYELQNEEILLKDFDATMNVSSNGQYGAAALIKNIFNAGTTTFSNIKVHGYLEGFWNMGSFYNYGTANYDDVGCDYEVVFNNCYSDATLVCASGNTIGGLFGHAFEGKGNSFTLRVNNTEYAGQMFLTTASGKGNKYFGMTSDYNNANSHFYFDGVEDTFNNGSSKNAGAYTKSTKIAKVVATKEENGYVVAKQANVSKIVVTITAQLTAYDTNNVQISNLSGITMTLSSAELTELEGSSIKVLDLFNSVNISKNAPKSDAYVANNALNIKLESSANYKSGNIRIQVNQYDYTGTIVSAGTLDVATCANATSEWVVK